jgi:Methyltransferase domain
MEQFDRCLSSASFEGPEVLAFDSAWIEHAPFAFWLVEQHRPDVLVELGTHSGYSYLCFCQQVRKSNLATRCFAVDTWAGDAHAGFYGEDIFSNLSRYHDPRYGQFSRLMRSRFEEAVGQFADASIDLLHLDGRHFYDDVLQDFEMWRPKLSARAVVLFHDTQVRERDFGVYRFWEEISSGMPHFEFKHGFGLGVLGVGAAAAELPLFSAPNDTAAGQAIAVAYARLGATFSLAVQVAQLRAEVTRLRRPPAAPAGAVSYQFSWPPTGANPQSNKGP